MRLRRKQIRLSVAISVDVTFQICRRSRFIIDVADHLDVVGAHRSCRLSGAFQQDEVVPQTAQQLAGDHLAGVLTDHTYDEDAVGAHVAPDEALDVGGLRRADLAHRHEPRADVGQSQGAAERRERPRQQTDERDEGDEDEPEPKEDEDDLVVEILTMVYVTEK